MPWKVPRMLSPYRFAPWQWEYTTEEAPYSSAISVKGEVSSRMFVGG